MVKGNDADRLWCVDVGCPLGENTIPPAVGFRLLA